MRGGWEEGWSRRRTSGPGKKFWDLVLTPLPTAQVSYMLKSSIQPNLTFTGHQQQRQEGAQKSSYSLTYINIPHQKMYSSGWEMVSFYSFDLHFSQFSSVTQSCPTLRSHGLQYTRLPCHHQLPESTQTHTHWVGDAIQPSHPLLSLSLPAINLSQHHGLFKWASSLHQVAKVLEFPLQHQSFQWIFRTDFL